MGSFLLNQFETGALRKTEHTHTHTPITPHIAMNFSREPRQRFPTYIMKHDTVDGRNPAPPKKPWNCDSPVNTNK